MQKFKMMLADKIKAASEELFPGADLSDVNFYDMFEYPPDPEMGDVALPCFKLAKIFRKAPPMISGALSGYDYGDSVADVKCASGYLNFKVSNDYLASSVLKEIEEQGEQFGSNKKGRPRSSTTPPPISQSRST